MGELKISLAFLVLIGSLALVNLTSVRHDDRQAFNVGLLFARQDSNEGQALNSPDVRRQIAEINNQIPVKTVDQKSANDYWKKVLDSF